MNNPIFERVQMQAAKGKATLGSFSFSVETDRSKVEKRVQTLAR